MRTDAAARPDSHAQDVALLEQLNRGYVRAAQTSDAKWYADHLDADYMASNPDGSLVDRAGFIARVARSSPGAEYEARDVRVRIIGDLGIIQSAFRSTKPDGQVRDGCYTDVWSRRHGRWLCISAHFAMF